MSYESIPLVGETKNGERLLLHYRLTKGDANFGLYAGDEVVVDRDKYPKHGDLVLAYGPANGYVSGLYQCGADGAEDADTGGPELYPGGHSAGMAADNLVIIGTVCDIIRACKTSHESPLDEAGIGGLLFLGGKEPPPLRLHRPPVQKS